MKKTLVALAALSTFAGAALAQSSVTLFGTVDLAARYTKANGQNVKQLASSGLSSSRFGIRGEEDLGGGLKAGFWLESPINGDTGAAGGGAFWDRRASVSLMGAFGEVRLGRGKTSTRLVIDEFDVHGTTGLGDSTRLYSDLGSGYKNVNRSSNQVQYFLPGNLNGVYGSVDMAAGEGVEGNKSYGGRIGYKAGALNVAGGYQSTDAAQGKKLKLGSIGGSYDFGVAKASALYSQLKFGDRKQNIFTAGVAVPVTTQGQVLAQFSKASGNAVTDKEIGGDAKMYSLSYVHNLSKRTALYTTASLIDNDNGAGFQVANDAAKVGKGGRSGGLDVGIRHSF